MAVLLLLLGCLITRFTTLLSLDTSQCIAPLGMESGVIKDEDITASSSFDSNNVGPHHGRVRLENNGGAWCPKHQITTEPREWLEINLHTVHVITATETQGRFGNGQGQEFAEAYFLEYWRPKLGKWVRYRNAKGEEVVRGNTNTYLESKRELDPPIWASRIRFLPYSYHFRTVCMRVEIYGCYWSDGIVSYRMPQGDKRGMGWEFFDATYDGHWDDELRRGLGQLTDGKIGPENFRMGYYENERGQGWVGWKNDTRNNRPIEITFEFDRVREFNAVHLYCNNQFTRDVQVFSELKISFSIGGKYFPGAPITYAYIEDRIFENSRNVSIKLHHRIGRFVRLQLYFAARWIMLSEVTFDSVVAHGNFNVESPPQETPLQSDVYVEQRQNKENIQTPAMPAEPPLSTASQEDSTYMAVIIGVLMAVILLLGVAIFLIISRHRQRKCFGSKTALPVPLTSDCGVSEKIGCKGSLEDNYNQSQRCLSTMGPMGSSTISSLPSKSGADANLLKLDDYQEPYQALKYAPYYSYSTVVMEMRDMLTNNNKSSTPGMHHHSDNYDYAVPELGTTPLLAQKHVINGLHISDKDGSFAKNSPENRRKSPLNQQEVMTALRRRLEETTVPEFPRHRLRMLSKLSDGAFGTVYVAEADGVLEYSSCTSLGKRLVAVKFLSQDASDREKMDFHRDIRILAALEDENIARVLGVCTREEPECVIVEYLEHGDLRNFLHAHIHQPENNHPRTLPPQNHPSPPNSLNMLSFNCLLYIATQIASGMRYLETLNFVHRDLATRNCLIGKGYQVKISDFATENELFAEDYYKVDGGLALPVRWMAWESVYLCKYTTKSDVWAFAVTLWEILTLARHPPYEGLSDAEVVENLQRLHLDTGTFLTLPRPSVCPKDLFDLMNECWRRADAERPTFREIHLFLQRKNLGYAPTT